MNASSFSSSLFSLYLFSFHSELLDTFFIVIHKKNLIFLHWYHHISVLMYCWYSYVKSSPVGIIFCSMNFAVHALMYFYYFLMAVKQKPKWFNPVWITVAQISQMIVGVAVTIAGWYIILVIKPAQCFMKADTNTAALLMYGSYLFLFLQFFLQRYFVVKKPSSSNGSSSTIKKTVTNGTSKRSKKE
jgi:elongation of very long chain fatty acids protein 6